MSLARFLPTLQRVSSFHEHCQKVVGNVVEQLCALHSTDAVIHVGDAYLRPVHDRLAKVYSALVALDEVIRGNLGGCHLDWLNLTSIFGIFFYLQGGPSGC